MPPQRYDTIGRDYAYRRRADRRVMAQIETALGSASSVINVGAGAGAYEPAGRRVVAVEPSAVMISQRRQGGVVLQAVAEALPVADRSSDAALATFTVHHWTDPGLGLAEMRRVADHQVVLTFDQDDAWLEAFWLTRDYLPKEHFTGRMFSGLDEVLEGLGPARVEVVPVPSDCQDGFFCAHWRRPEAYLDPAIRAGISALALVDPLVLEPGLAQLAADLANGTWEDRNKDLLALECCDFGYRLVVA